MEGAAAIGFSEIVPLQLQLSTTGRDVHDGETAVTLAGIGKAGLSFV
jgi:hypothetical protein